MYETYEAGTGWSNNNNVAFLYSQNFIIQKQQEQYIAIQAAVKYKMYTNEHSNKTLT